MYLTRNISSTCWHLIKTRLRETLFMKDCPRDIQPTQVAGFTLSIIRLSHTFRELPTQLLSSYPNSALLWLPCALAFCHWPITKYQGYYFKNSSMKCLIVAFTVRKLSRLLFTILHSVLFMRTHRRNTSLVLLLGTAVLLDLWFGSVLPIS